MKIHTHISDINEEQWKQLVANSPTATFFQTHDCYDFFASLSFLEPFVFGVSENEQLVGLISGYVISDGVLAKKFLSRRAIVVGGVLLDSLISEDALIQLLRSTKDGLKSKAIYTEIRNYNDYSTYTSVFEKAGFLYSAHLNFHVSTPDRDSALKQLSTTKRRDVKLSGKAGAEWYATTDINDVHAYYQMLSHLYKTKVKTPLFPLEFFEKLVQLPNAKLFVVKHEGELIGGSVCVLLPNKTLYEWFVCGLDGKIKNVFPSTVATWAAIEYASEHSIERFDMMGAGKPDDGYGVRDFKSKFGGKLVEHGRFIVINNKLLFEIGKLGVKLTRYTFKSQKKVAKPVVSYTIETNYEQIDKQVWADFVLKHPSGNVFHTPQMYDLYVNTPKFRPVLLVAKNDKGAIVGCLMSVIQREYKNLLGELTTRSIVFGGPLVENNNVDIVDALLLKYNKIIDSRAIYTQFRNLSDLSVFTTAFSKNGYLFEEHLDILVDLTLTRGELEQNLHKERKRNIAKAEKEGLIFKHLTEKEDIANVIELLKMTYQRVKVPMSYEQVFINSQDYLVDNVHFFGAYYDGKMIAGQVRLCYKDLVYAWFSGSDSDYLHKRPNDFLLWNVLLWSKENGYKVFDFGGAGKPGIPYGVRDYKLKFGGELVNNGRFVKTHKPLFMSFGKIIYSVYRKILR